MLDNLSVVVVLTEFFFFQATSEFCQICQFEQVSDVLTDTPSHITNTPLLLFQSPSMTNSGDAYRVDSTGFIQSGCHRISIVEICLDLDVLIFELR